MKDRAIQTLKNGGTVLLATDTVYGLAALPTSARAVAKIYDLKQRPRDMFLPVMVACVDDLAALGLDINGNARRLLDSELVPGAVTFVLGFRDEALKPAWLASRDEIAARIPDDALLLAILRATGPLLVTSANRHGRRDTPSSVNGILKDLNGAPDLVIDGGECRDVPSTIINCRHDPPVIERCGLIEEVIIRKIIEK